MGKMLTPSFGGTSQVWMTCMLFFQVCLLVGYAYAHLLVTKTSLRFQRNFHALLLGCSALMLFYQGKMGRAPLDFGSAEPGAGSMVGSIFGYLVAHAGLPAVMLSATSPLLQSWFCKRSPEVSPYRLYAVSHLGSLLGLLSYPFVAESRLDLPSQGWLFAFAFLGMLCIPALVPRYAVIPFRTSYGVRTSIKEVVAWAFCSAVGSCLFMAGSVQVSIEVAAIPLLWVIPFALYLGTFILVFEFPVVGYQRTLLALASICLAVSYWLMIWPSNSAKPMYQAWSAFGTVFFGALLCHGFMYALRPPAERLTAFYLSLATGGVLGALFVALIAPSLYDRLMELPAAVVLSGIVGVLWGLSFPSGALRTVVLLPAMVVLVGATGMWALSNRPGVWLRDHYGTIHILQSGRLRTLIHGRAIHGVVHADHLSEPLAYYHGDSGAGLAFERMRGLKSSLKVGIMGLGVGSLATYARQGDQLVIYEVSPSVLYVAGPKGRAFPLLKRCPGAVEIVTGDARVSLAREMKEKGSRKFDLLFLDAFSSDSVPWHLLTVEALKLYLDHLSPDGLLVANVSTRLPLDKVLCSGAASLGAYGLLVARNAPKVEEEALLGHLYKTSYVLVARNKKSLDDKVLLGKAGVGFGPTPFSLPIPGFPSLSEVWTDQRSSLSDLIFEEKAF